jgi:predicted MFS family arabinose efflux permease
MLVAGTSGALLATEPVRWLMPSLGWRGMFWLVAGLLVLASAAIYFLMPKPREELNPPAPQQGNWLKGYAPVFSNPYFWKLAPIGMVCQSGFIALQTLWIGPWMVQVLGYSPEASARLLLIFNFVLLLSYLNLSWLAPRMARRGIPVPLSAGIGLGICTLFQAVIVFTHGTWAWLLWPLMAVFTVATTLVHTNVSLAFPANLAGRANAGFNVLIFSSAFIWQWGLGLLIDVFKNHGYSSANAMRATLGVFVVVQVLGLMAFLFNPAKQQVAA